MQVTTYLDVRNALFEISNRGGERLFTSSNYIESYLPHGAMRDHTVMQTGKKSRANTALCCNSCNRHASSIEHLLTNDPHTELWGWLGSQQSRQKKKQKNSALPLASPAAVPVPHQRPAGKERNWSPARPASPLHQPATGPSQLPLRIATSEERKSTGLKAAPRRPPLRGGNPSKATLTLTRAKCRPHSGNALPAGPSLPPLRNPLVHGSRRLNLPP